MYELLGDETTTKLSGPAAAFSLLTFSHSLLKLSTAPGPPGGAMTTALVSCSVGFRDNFLIGLVVTLSPAGVDTLEVKTSCHRCGNPRISDAVVPG